MSLFIFAADDISKMDRNRARVKQMANDPWLQTKTSPDFQVTPALVEKDAKLFADMWLRHPAYKMTLDSVQKVADTNADGEIDRQEFRMLLQASGYTGGTADALFTQIDVDQSGTLTKGEIKALHQGKQIKLGQKR